eukprot:6491808-Amphidinium_carterae.2
MLDYMGNHFYLKATIFDGLYDYVDYTPDFANWYQEWYDENDYNNKVYGLLQDDAEQGADYPQQEAQATQQEIEEHNLTHLPYRDWVQTLHTGKEQITASPTRRTDTAKHHTNRLRLPQK